MARSKGVVLYTIAVPDSGSMLQGEAANSFSRAAHDAGIAPRAGLEVQKIDSFTTLRRARNSYPGASSRRRCAPGSARLAGIGRRSIQRRQKRIGWQPALRIDPVTSFSISSPTMALRLMQAR